MNGRLFFFRSSVNPLAQILSLLVFGALLTVALVMGFVMITLLLGLAVILGVVLAVRAWWFRRKFRGSPRYDGAPRPADSGRMIEGEYKIVGDPDAQATRRKQ
jgi:protein-S-isoprenylcysteine O-methyltransferase Ste14